MDKKEYSKPEIVELSALNTLTKASMTKLEQNKNQGTAS